MVVVTAVALGISLYRTLQENQRLRQENTRLKGEVGEITIKDGEDNKLHVIAVPSSEFMTWKWRLFVPKDRSFGISIITHDIGKQGNIPTDGLVFKHLAPGEHSFSATMRKNENTNQWEWVFDTDGNGKQIFGPPREDVQWINERYGYSDDQAGDRKLTVTAEPGEPMELLRYTVARMSANQDPILFDGKGALIWIQEIK
jgi:hypothetical protein